MRKFFFSSIIIILVGIQFVNAKEKRMFQISRILEAGGVEMNLIRGGESRNLRIDSRDQTFKLEEGAKYKNIRWGDLSSANYEKGKNSIGLLRLHYKNPMDDDRKYMQIAVINDSIWKRISEIIGQKLSLIEEDSPHSPSIDGNFHVVDMKETWSVGVTFKQGESTMMFSVLSDSKSVTLNAPNRSDTLDWKDFDSIVYERDGGKGVLTGYYLDEKGKKDVYVEGIINDEAWERLRAIIGKEIKMVQEN